ncbi:F-box/LRR-repeat protein 2 isoform X2 [Monodelphis domestica]|uniref:F-box/LRR-repeat protein 2 isoform X2 n=1 Tax=Monodelphis domestica TaxID=13616 RepID=UPI0024E1F915|nr:F-box/LRR-repeat protein 2 isoform X2 [Monodelphis domestica]
MAELLPPEMLSYILSFLPLSDQKEASLVNRAWYYAAQNALRELDVRYNIPVASASLTSIKSLSRRHVSCVSLADVDSSSDCSDVLQSISYYLGPHLQSLSLGGGTLTQASFIGLVTSCPGLRVLDLSGCNSLFMSGMLLAQPEIVQKVRDALAGLRDLNLSNLRSLADASFNQLASCAPKLERLSLARCHIAFDPYISLPAQQDSSTVFSFRNLLHFLKERAGHLLALDLSGTGLNPMGLQALGQVVGLRLQELTLRSCRDISNEAVATLCRQQRGLTSLDLSGCSELADGALLAVSRGLQGLRHLRMEKLQRLTDAGFLALHRLQELRSLDIAECCLVNGRELVKALEFPKGPLPHLASLRLAYCSLLKDASVVSLAQGPLRSSLKLLDLSSCMSLTDSSLLAISANLPLLTILRLAWSASRALGPPRVPLPRGSQQAAQSLTAHAEGLAGAGPHSLQQADGHQPDQGPSLPLPEAAVPEPAPGAHGHRPGGRGQRLPWPGAPGAEPLQPPERPGLGPGCPLLAAPAAPQPLQLQPAHRGDTGHHREGVPAAEGSGRVPVPGHQHGRSGALADPAASGDLSALPLCGGGRPDREPLNKGQCLNPILGCSPPPPSGPPRRCFRWPQRAVVPF